MIVQDLQCFHCAAHFELNELVAISSSRRFYHHLCHLNLMKSFSSSLLWREQPYGQGRVPGIRIYIY